MIKAPPLANEAARLAALRQYQGFLAEPDPLCDELTRVAAHVCSTPLAALCLVDADHLQHKSLVGELALPTAREGSFCAWAILTPDPLVITDAGQDERFKDYPPVTASRGIRFYAGAPLLTPEGQALGTLCVLDWQPRALTLAQIGMLQALAQAVMTRLELQRQRQDLDRANAERAQLTQMAVSEERYALAVRCANDGVWDWNLKTDEVYYSARWKALLGYSEPELSGNPEEWLSRIHPEDIEAFRTDLAAHLAGLTARFEHECRVRQRDGDYRWMLSRGLTVWGESDEATRLVGTLTDVTPQKEAEGRLFHNAFHDALTGLPNRTLFTDRLTRSLNRAKHREDYLFAVLFLDLDRFKSINDSLGHELGDQLLMAIARRLEMCLRPGDMIARLGSDEFAVILDHLKHISDATQTAERLLQDLAAPFHLCEQEVFASASIGITLSLARYERPEDCLRDADTALHRAKQQGRGCMQLFDSGMHTQAAAQSHLETDMRWALSRGEFQVHYQPIILLENWQVAGFEALLRWEHPQLGVISPRQFIPLAEETGLIVPLGQWALREACRQLRVWHKLFPADPPLTMSVNLSGKQFAQPNLIEQIQQILNDTGLAAHTLKLEITESTIIENTELATAMLKQLRELGIRVSLDDFGTGYSSLSYLHRFPIDTLKIDRSFVTRMNLPRDSEIVRTILALAGNLGMDVIAEGVETGEQIVQLTGMNCEYAQGYLFSRPIDAEAVTNLLQETAQKRPGAKTNVA
jgi:diguanylate cyclase (GGDEF)-like protein/PAS domain S-box-containing protein